MELRRKERAFVDECRVGLEQRRTCVEASERVFGGFDPARCHEDEPAVHLAREASENLECARFHGATAEPAGTHSFDLRRGAHERLTEDCGVGGDDAIEAELEGEGGQFIEVIVREIGGHFDEQWHAFSGGAPLERVTNLRQNRAQSLGTLQIAKARRIGRAHVDDAIIREWTEHARARRIVLRGLAVGCELGLSEVDADDRRAPPFRETCRRRCRSAIVETQAIDECAIRRQSEESRLWVACLWLGGDGADLDKSEAERAEGIGCERVFVKARGESEGPWKLEPECAHNQAWGAWRECASAQCHHSGDRHRGAQAAERERVRGLSRNS